jgi:hypothetical protein
VPQLDECQRAVAYEGGDVVRILEFVDDRATRLLEARRDRTAQHLDVALDDERA